MRERGSGITPPRVVELLKNEITKKGLLTVAAETEVGKSAISRYAKGIGEPTTASLGRLAVYFGESVEYLRGEDDPELFAMYEHVLESYRSIFTFILEQETPLDTGLKCKYAALARELLNKSEKLKISCRKEDLEDGKKLAMQVLQKYAPNEP